MTSVHSYIIYLCLVIHLFVWAFFFWYYQHHSYVMVLFYSWSHYRRHYRFILIFIVYQFHVLQLASPLSAVSLIVLNHHQLSSSIIIFVIFVIIILNQVLISLFFCLKKNYARLVVSAQADIRFVCLFLVGVLMCLDIFSSTYTCRINNYQIIIIFLQENNCTLRDAVPKRASRTDRETTCHLR
jgi:hypothetical protein